MQALGLAILSEDGCLARSGAQQVEQDSDGGSLAGAIQPEEAKDLAAGNLQIQAVYREDSAVAFGQSTNRDGSGAGEHNRF